MTANPASHDAFTAKVGITRLPSCSYPSPDQAENPISQALLRLADTMDWSDERGPFGRVVRGARGF